MDTRPSSRAHTGGTPPCAVRLTRTAQSTALSVLAVLVIIPMAVAPAPGRDSDRIASTRAALDRWVETRRLISEERESWRLGREMLEQRIALMEREIAQVLANVAAAEAEIREADEQRAALDTELARLREARVVIETAVESLEGGTRSLLSHLPDPLRDRIQPLSQRLPAPSTLPEEAPIAERYQVVVGIINEVTRFNRELTTASELRSLPDGSTAEVTTMYVGLGRAYYLGANGRIAGTGAPTPQGWTWTQVNADATAIARAISILRNESIAAFVPLPFVAVGEGNIR